MRNSVAGRGNSVCRVLSLEVTKSLGFCPVGPLPEFLGANNSDSGCLSPKKELTGKALGGLRELKMAGHSG